MSCETADYINVREKLEVLGIDISSELLILPRFFDTSASLDKMYHESSARTVVKLLNKAGIQGSTLQSQGEKLGTIKENNITWIGPTLFIASLMWSQNPQAVDLALNIIANYASDFFLGRFGEKKARISFVIENEKGECKKLIYEGPVEGLKEIRSSLEQLAK